MIRPILISTIFYLLIACSGGSAITSSNNTNSTIDPLASLAFSSDLINPEPRFASYSPVAARASIIDPQNKTEIWGFQAPGFNFASPHEGFNGITLFSSNKIRIVTTHSEKDFLLASQYDNIAISKTGISYSLSNSSGTILEVIRSIGNGQWQQESFNIPWPAIADEEIFEGNVSAALVSLFSNDGNTLYVFNPADGKYMKLSAADNISPLQTDYSYCEGNGNTQSENVFRSLTLDETSNLLIAGDGKGSLIQINLNNGCHDYTNSTVLSLGINEPVLNINQVSENELIVTQYNSNIHFVNYSLNNFNSAISFNSICLLPVASLLIDNNLTLITCLPGIRSNFDIERPYYQLFNKNTENPEIEIKFDNKFSGIGVDVGNLKLYRMLESSLGILQTVSLLDGGVDIYRGIFLDSILNEL